MYDIYDVKELPRPWDNSSLLVRLQCTYSKRDKSQGRSRVRVLLHNDSIEEIRLVDSGLYQLNGLLDM